jgi:NAD(P)-dependent dehydrogenase (short-subunit alcohol dehydrogenase family)
VSTGRLAGRVAIVTGGARGLGRSIVRRFADEGASVLIADVLEDDGNQLAAELSGAGLDVAFTALDVRDEDGWERAARLARGRFGGFHVLVNNAGIVRTDSVAEETLDGFRQVLEVNLVGVFLGMRTAIREFGDDGGAIVNISSTWGLVGANGSAGYHASKGGVTVLTKNAAVDYARRGIRVNSIHPGPMQTAIADAVGDEGMAMIAQRTPMKRVGLPDEVAHAAVFLASDEASFATGSGLIVDGGYTAW